MMIQRAFHTMMTGMVAIGFHFADAREFSIPEYQANPGGQVDVPVMLDDAGGLCMVNFQVNYDANILQLVSVNRGSLGLNFSEFSTDQESGVIRATLANETDLVAGVGALVIMRFNMRGGGDTTVSADVSLASYDYSDSSGVVALSQEEATNAISGEVQAANSAHIDNFGNQLPDWWEDLHGLDKFSMLTANSDADGDGATAILEYGLNGNPNQADARSLFGIGRKSENPSVMQLSLQLRNDDPSLVYQLGTSSNLTNWTRYPITWNGTAWSIDNNPLGISIGSSVSEGNGIWTLKLEQSSEGGGKQFFRTEVDR